MDFTDMDITCPSLAPIDETSDYGSRETSHNDEEAEGFTGFSTIPNLLGMSRLYYVLVLKG